MRECRKWNGICKRKPEDRCYGKVSDDCMEVTHFILLFHVYSWSEDACYSIWPSHLFQRGRSRETGYQTYNWSSEKPAFSRNWRSPDFTRIIFSVSITKSKYFEFCQESSLKREKDFMSSIHWSEICNYYSEQNGGSVNKKGDWK